VDNSDEVLTFNQHVKLIPNQDTGKPKRSVEERADEFVSNPDIKALSITWTTDGLMILY
jgi:hypothetical protein